MGLTDPDNSTFEWSTCLTTTIFCPYRPSPNKGGTAINNASHHIIVIPHNVGLQGKLDSFNPDVSLNLTIMSRATDNDTVLYNDTIPKTRIIIIAITHSGRITLVMLSLFWLPVSIWKNPSNWHNPLANSFPFKALPIMSKKSPTEDIRKSVAFKLNIR